MKTQSILGFVVAATGFFFGFGESSALAARLPSTCRATLKAPTECTGRNATSYTAGVGQGVSTVDQIWESDTVGEDPDNWEILVARVTTTIPRTVATVYETTWNEYLKCRVQGLLEGTVCRMNELDPIPGCQLDGADWGNMSAALYCALSVDLGGLGDVVPWFIRPVPGMCGSGFQTYCEAVYEFGATRGAIPLDPAVSAHLKTRGVDVLSYYQPETCLPYTADPWRTVFDNSVYIDCSYTIP